METKQENTGQRGKPFQFGKDFQKLPPYCRGTPLEFLKFPQSKGTIVLLKNDWILNRLPIKKRSYDTSSHGPVQLRRRLIACVLGKGFHFSMDALRLLLDTQYPN